MNQPVQNSAKPLMEVEVNLEFTPNPNTLKYTTNASLLLAGTESFKSKESAEGKSPLAAELFKISAISGVMVGRNFVTVTLAEQDSLTEVNEEIIESMKAFIRSGIEAVNPEALSHQHTEDLGNRSDIEQKIIQVLDEEIRPAVAMDGGDITFEKYQDGIVFLHMKGSCAGCPSSTATLKMGIENRLKDVIPEIIEVVAV